MSFQADDVVGFLFTGEGVDVDVAVTLGIVFSVGEDVADAFGCNVFFADD